MKKYSKYLIIITLEIIIFTIFITLKIEEKNDYVFVKNLSSDINLYVGEKEDLKINKINTLKTKFKFDPLNKHYYGNNDQDIFSLSFNHSNLKVGDILKYKGALSDQIYLIFRNSYPLVSLEEMGVINEEEAYFAIQLALWEMADRTQESMYTSEGARINAIRSYVGEARINARVYNAASKLIQFVEKWTKAPNDNEVKNILKLTDDKASFHLEETNLKYLAGPFKYEMTNAIIKDANLEAKDEDGNQIQIDFYNDKGEKVIDLKTLHKKNFYLAFPKNIKNFEYTLNVSYYDLRVNSYIANSSDYAARIYTIENDSISHNITIE